MCVYTPHRDCKPVWTWQAAMDDTHHTAHPVILNSYTNSELRNIPTVCCLFLLSPTISQPWYSIPSYTLCFMNENWLKKGVWMAWSRFLGAPYFLALCILWRKVFQSEDIYGISENVQVSVLESTVKYCKCNLRMGMKEFYQSTFSTNFQTFTVVSSFPMKIVPISERGQSQLYDLDAVSS